MRLGMLLRNSGPASSPELISACARAGENAGLDDLWVLDHIAIPPDEAEGSGGRYVDPLATLAFVAGQTSRIGLGVSVLVVPYRPALPTAKWIASIQELSAGRLTLGAGAGWMAAEFTAAGVSRTQRGRITDDTLAFLHECFTHDIVEANGQRFIFSPRPQRPRILIGGNGTAALARAAAYGDGWMPTNGKPEELREPVQDLTARMREAGKPAPDVVPLLQLDLDDVTKATDQLAALAAVGVTGVDHTARYETLEEFSTIAGKLVEARERAGV